MNPTFSCDEEAFRTEVVEFLRDYSDLEGFHFQNTRWAEVKALYAAVGRKDWLSLGWEEDPKAPRQGPTYEYILWDEMAYARCARPPLGAGIVAKTILKAGSADQRQRWLAPIRAGEIFFSLGYSEPEAGSDLASVRTRATRDGDAYVLSGEKCWTSYAQDSDYLWTLARTGETDSRARGLSIFIVDLKAPGIRIDPLPLLDGERLNQIHLDGVRVPVRDRIGEENAGWQLIHEALAVERHVQFPPKRLLRDFEDLVAWARAANLGDDPRVRAQLGELAVRVRETEVLGLRVLEAIQKGRDSSVDAAYNKLAGSELCQAIARTALDLGGPEALERGSRMEFLWRQSTWETIGGGTSEIMRGLIARQALKLGASR